MRKNIQKTLLSIVVAATIATFSGPVSANKITVNMPTFLHENKSSERLSSGVVHEKIRKFTTAGWWNINVLRIDLSDPYTDIRGLVNPDGIPKRDKVSSMVEKSGAIAGINGDYFNYSPLPSAMGTLINDGEVISSPIEKPYDLPNFFIDFLNQAKIGYIDRYTTATNARTGQVVYINTINKVTPNFDTVTLLNKHWGKQSIGNRFHKDLIEVVVEDNVVKDVRKGQEATSIPENGYVLAIRGAKHQNLHQFAIGDEVKLSISTTPSADSIKFAIGGGSIILKDGELALTDIHSTGNNPRSGVGISKDGKEIILVTIDGRDSAFKGVSQSIFGAILRDLGAYNGLNLDGGGSTTMAVKPVDTNKVEVVNKPSEGSERPVVNGIGVFSDAPVGELASLKVIADDPNMFIDTSRTFTVKGYDQYHNPVPVDESQLTFTQEGVEGTIKGNSFKASSSGKAIVTAHYGEDISASTEVRVLGVVKHISTDLSSFNIDINSEKKLPTFTARDGNGYSAKVDSKDINFTNTNDIGKVENGVFYSSSTSIAGALTARLGEGVANILVSVGGQAQAIENFDNVNNFKFNRHPEFVQGGIGVSSDAKVGSNSLSLKYDFSGGEGTRAAYLDFTHGKSGLALSGAPTRLGLWVKGDNQGSWLRGTLKDNKGNTLTIDFAKSLDFDDWQYVTADIPSNMNFPISLERIYVVETNSLKKHSGEILLDGLTASYPHTTEPMPLPTPSSVKDDKNVAVAPVEKGYSIGVTMEPKGLDKLVQYNASSKIKERLNKHTMSIFLGGASEEFKKGLTTTSRINANNVYSRNRRDDVTFINVNTSKKGIRATDASQWTKLTADLNSINTNNLILFLSSPLYGAEGFTDTLEADLLNQLLLEVRDTGKNVFVVYGGSSTTTDLKDGIRYIGMNTKPVTKASDIYNLSILEFTVNQSDVTYQISPLFPKP